MLAGTRDNRNGERSGVRGCRGRIPLAPGKPGQTVRSKAAWWQGGQPYRGGWVGVSSRPKASVGREKLGVGRRRSNRQASMRPTFKILGAMGGGASTNQVMREPRRSWLQGPVFRAVQACAWGATLTMTSTFFPHPTWPTSLTLLGAALHSCDCFICLVEKRFSQGFSTLGSPPSNLAQTDAAFLVEKDRQGL